MMKDMPKREHLTNLFRAASLFKPLVNENGKFTGEFKPKDPDADLTRDELLLIVGMALREVNAIWDELEGTMCGFDVLSGLMEEAHSYLHNAGIKGKPFVESIQTLHDKYQQAVDCLLAIAISRASADQLRERVEKGLHFIGEPTLTTDNETPFKVVKDEIGPTEV